LISLLGRLELATSRLASAEAHVEDLKLQLDDALGAEDMLEQLTDKNLQMSEVSSWSYIWDSGADCLKRMEEMRLIIEDLESLKELNDELEENHVEAERVLNEEISELAIDWPQ
jgi:dynactin 1